MVGWWRKWAAGLFAAPCQASVRTSGLCVLGQNPFEVDESTIKDIPVCRTYLAGELVYEA